MTYQGKTIKKHARGNWFVRVRHGNKVISIYGRTQLDCYDKLRLIADKIESEKAVASAERYLAKLQGLTTYNFMQNAPPQAESQVKPSYTLQQWFDEWLNSYKVGRVRQATIVAFRRAFKNYKPLHDTPIAKITSLMLSKVINAMSGHGMKTQVNNLAQQMFLVAFNNRLIEYNPASNFTAPKRVAKSEKKALTQEQEKTLIDLCLADIDKYEPLLICVLQGLRKGEMLALRPNDLCFERNTLRVDESYDEQHPDDLETKNRESNRTMPMFATTREILLRHIDKEPTERIYKDYRSHTLNKRLQKLCKDNELPRITIHELRHTFITRCNDKNIDEIVTQKWVGHAKGSRMTKAIYTHVTDDTELKYIDVLNGTDKGTAPIDNESH